MTTVKVSNSKDFLYVDHIKSCNIIFENYEPKLEIITILSYLMSTVSKTYGENIENKIMAGMKYFSETDYFEELTRTVGFLYANAVVNEIEDTRFNIDYVKHYLYRDLCNINGYKLQYLKGRDDELEKYQKNIENYIENFTKKGMDIDMDLIDYNIKSYGIIELKKDTRPITLKITTITNLVCKELPINIKCAEQLLGYKSASELPPNQVTAREVLAYRCFGCPEHAELKKKYIKLQEYEDALCIYAVKHTVKDPGIYKDSLVGSLQGKKYPKFVRKNEEYLAQQFFIVDHVFDIDVTSRFIEYILNDKSFQKYIAAWKNSEKKDKLLADAGFYIIGQKCVEVNPINDVFNNKLLEKTIEVYNEFSGNTDKVVVTKYYVSENSVNFNFNRLSQQQYNFSSKKLRSLDSPDSYYFIENIKPLGVRNGLKMSIYEEFDKNHYFLKK